MHITSTFTTLLAAAAVAVAGPAPGYGGGWQNGFCGLTEANLNDLISGYTYLLINPGGPDFNTTAARILTDDFSVFSDSINSLANRPLGGLSFPPGRAGFIASQAQTPPIPKIDTLDVFVGTNYPSDKGSGWSDVCSNLKVSWRVVFSGIGSNQFPVKGILDFDLAAGPKGGDAVGIKTVYSEFNTAAWLRNYGVQCVTPPRPS